MSVLPPDLIEKTERQMVQCSQLLFFFFFKSKTLALGTHKERTQHNITNQPKKQTNKKKQNKN